MTFSFKVGNRAGIFHTPIGFDLILLAVVLGFLCR